jgi:hypothetical protein
VKRASRDVRLDFVVEISPHDYLHIDHVRDLSLADLEIGSSMLLTSSFITFFQFLKTIMSNVCCVLNTYSNVRCVLNIYCPEPPLFK